MSETTLTISDFAPVRRPKWGVGSKANFRINTKATGVIVQNVTHHTTLEGHRTTHRFMEGWKVDRGVVQDGGGADFFLVPPDYRDVKGTVEIDATAWFIPGATFTGLGMRRRAVAIAGTLHARKRTLKPPRTHIRRQWKASWRASDVGVRAFQPTITHKTNYVF
jgi:hypothetical protein